MLGKKETIELLNQLITTNRDENFLLIHNKKLKKNCELFVDYNINTIEICYLLTKSEIIELYKKFHGRLLII